MNVVLTPNATDIAILQRMFGRLQTAGRKDAKSAVAWTAYYVATSIGAQTKKERSTKRPLIRTTPDMPEIRDLASKQGRTPEQVAGWHKWGVKRYKRGSDNVTWMQLLNRYDDPTDAQTINHRGYSKLTWRWMAAAAKKQSPLRRSLLHVMTIRDPLNPGVEFRNSRPWMHRIVGDLSGVYAKGERQLVRYFERQLAKSAKAARA